MASDKVNSMRIQIASLAVSERIILFEFPNEYFTLWVFLICDIDIKSNPNRCICLMLQFVSGVAQSGGRGSKLLRVITEGGILMTPGVISV